MQDDLKTAHDESTFNRERLIAAGRCGCFHCLTTYLPDEITDWIPDHRRDGSTDETALCPRCGIDSVIAMPPGGPRDESFLRRMNEEYFQESYSWEEFERIFAQREQQTPGDDGPGNRG